VKSHLNLYKEQGVTGVIAGMTGESPLDIAKRVSGRTDAEKLFGKTSLVTTVDKRIDHVGHRLLALITACSWDRPFLASFAELAEAIPDCCERTAIRKCKLLEQLGYIGIQRSKNRRNLYWTKATMDEKATPVSPARRKVQLQPCGFCQTPCVPQKRTGWCRKCSAEARNRVITKTLVREEVAVALSKTGTA
jgi:hypothetical protein